MNPRGQDSYWRGYAVGLLNPYYWYKKIFVSDYFLTIQWNIFKITLSENQEFNM